MGVTNVDHEPPEQAMGNPTFCGWRLWVLPTTSEKSPLRSVLVYGVLQMEWV